MLKIGYNTGALAVQFTVPGYNVLLYPQSVALMVILQLTFVISVIFATLSQADEIELVLLTHAALTVGILANALGKVINTVSNWVEAIVKLLFPDWV